MPGCVFVGFGLCALKSAAHCIDAASAHIGGSPTTLGFPGMQVNPLLPSRSTTVLPCSSLSITRAWLVISMGPAERARAIFALLSSLSGGEAQSKTAIAKTRNCVRHIFLLIDLNMAAFLCLS